jgi:hypothetical protein
MKRYRVFKEPIHINSFSIYENNNSLSENSFSSYKTPSM